MSTENVVDSEKSIIITRWSGPVTEYMLNSVLKKYHDQYAQNAHYRDYNEVLLIDPESTIEVPTRHLQEAIESSISTDDSRKLAIIALNSLSYGLSRMYETYRNLTPDNRKVVRCFRNFEKAIEWLNCPLQEMA